MWIGEKVHINDKKMDEELLDIIENYSNRGDRQNVLSSKYITFQNNLIPKAVQKFNDYLKIIVPKIASKKFGFNNFPMIINDTWLMRYSKGDYARPHQHWPYPFACVYYIKVSENSSGLYLTNRKKNITVSSGDLIILNGSELHEVYKTVGDRYVIASNVIFDYKNV